MRATSVRTKLAREIKGAVVEFNYQSQGLNHKYKVSAEHWHPNQKGKFLEDGSYELKVPYSKDIELVMDILRYGAGVKVLQPKELRLQVIAEIDAMRLAYL